MESKTTYLGDGLYASYDGHMYKLWTDNGLTCTNAVFLEPEVLLAFVRFVEETKRK